MIFPKFVNGSTFWQGLKDMGYSSGGSMLTDYKAFLENVTGQSGAIDSLEKAFVGGSGSKIDGLRDYLSARGASGATVDMILFGITAGVLFGKYISYLLSSVICTRATTRTVWNNGVLETVAINTPAFTDGTTLSVADSATNLLLQSGFAGAVAGTPGTAPTSWSVVLANGTITAVNDQGLYNSVAVDVTANRHFYSQTVNVNASTVYLFSGVLHTSDDVQQIQNIFSILSLPAGATIAYTINGASVAATAVPTSGDVLGVVLTVAGTAGTASLRWGVGVQGAATGMAELGAVQFEVGSTRTPYIPTTTATVTRAADVCTIPVFNGQTVDKYAERLPFTPAATGQVNKYLRSFFVDATHRVDLYINATQVLAEYVDGASTDVAAFTYSHVKDTPMYADIYYDSVANEIGVRAAAVSGDIDGETFATATFAGITSLPSSSFIGCKDSADFAVGDYGNPTQYTSKESAGW